jgi:hypothetical protein
MELSELAHKSIESRFSEVNNSKSFACHPFDHICQDVADGMASVNQS